MSRLWPESIRLHVGPDTLRLVQKGREAVELPLTADWGASLAGLPALPARSRLHVTVADRHARYLRVAWPAGLKGAERAAFTAHRFQSVFGDMEAWALLADQGTVSFPSLACAMPVALVAAINEGAHARRLRVASLQPAFVSDFNRCRGRFRGDGAFARLETARITVGLWGDGRWRAVRSHPVEQADAAAAGRCLAALLATLPLEDVAPTGTLYVSGRDAAGPDSLPAGWVGVAVEDAP